MCRLPCRILNISGSVYKKYKLACCFGVLSVSYSAGDMIPFHGDLVIPDDVLGQIISLREAAKKSAASSCFLRNKCNCLSGCRTRKCSCVVNGIRCSTHCHHQHSCMNVDVKQPAVVTENYSALLSVTALTEDDVDDVLQARCLSDNVICALCRRC